MQIVKKKDLRTVMIIFLNFYTGYIYIYQIPIYFLIPSMKEECNC